MKKNSLKVLLVNAISPHVEVESRYPGLGLGYLAATARRELQDIAPEFAIVDRDVETFARDFQPNIVGISSVSQNFTIARSYADHFIRLGIPVIFGGFHVTALPKTLPEGVAAACLGEGEYTFVELLRAFMADGWNTKNLSNIHGIAFWNQGILERTPDRELITPLDRLPFPARDLLDIRPHSYLFTSRGCPFRCWFCASSRFWDKLRFFSAEYVAEEIELLFRQYGVNVISFFDDLFAADRARVEELIRLLERRQLLGKIRFMCNCRASIVDEKLAELLARLGIVSVGIGFESGCDETLRMLKGPRCSVAENESAIKYLKAAGIAVNGSFIIGSPDETLDQMRQTYDFIRHSGVDLVDIYLLSPFPGTPTWDYAVQQGFVSDDMTDWSCLDVNSYRALEKSVILSRKLSRKSVLAVYERFRRLRLRHNIKKLWNHPMLGDVPTLILRSMREKIRDLLG
ncbi:MAG: radical SAM protein [Candidatus Riflebacteria bacterium]|nr:radical SAM protein [Candidatus Riflebacteria bacterium]